jgi:hypothetical protein
MLSIVVRKDERWVKVAHPSTADVVSYMERPIRTGITGQTKLGSTHGQDGIEEADRR